MSAIISSTCIRLQSFFGTHCSLIFVRVVHMPSTSLTCVRVLQNLIGTWCCPIFVHATSMPSTSSICVRTHCRASLVPSSVLPSHLLRICPHCRWLHPYTLLLCHLHHRPAFACRASLVPTAVLHLYALLICNQHRRPAWICIAKPRRYVWLSYIPTCYMSATFAAGYIRMRYSSAVYIIDLHLYTLQSFIATHCCPTFQRTACMLSISLTCICVLQNLIGTCSCATFVRAALLSSTLSTCVDTHCRTLSLYTAVLHSYMLYICRLCCWLHLYALLVCYLHHRPAFARIVELRCYPLLSYIHTLCSSAINIDNLLGYSLQNLIAMYGCPTFLHPMCLLPLPLTISVHAARLLSTSSTCICTPCRASLLPTAVLYSNVLLLCHQHR